MSEVVPSRFDAATVYVTVDDHHENNFEPYIWVSTDFGATFHSIIGNLKRTRRPHAHRGHAQPGRALHRDGIGHLPDARSRQVLAAAQGEPPDGARGRTHHHPRDNALLVATHGRALWILDHLEPIQEYAAAQAASADANLFPPPPALQWKAKDDRNDEFWGHDFFTGENPPTDAVIQVCT